MAETAVSMLAALNSTWRYCTRAGWAGWDPYDALTASNPAARILKTTRIGRLALTQLMKRSPVNLRPLLRVPATCNAKSLALGILATCRCKNLAGLDPSPLVEGAELVRRLLDASIETKHGFGWGFPFEYEVRAFRFPLGTPTVVITAIVVRALHEALCSLQLTPDTVRKCRGAIDGAAEFVLHDLQRIVDQDGLCFSYSPLDRSRVVNATLFAAEILARATAVRGSEVGVEEIASTVKWSWARQTELGGWPYGDASHHQWQDSFHTGFNLLSLDAVRTLVEPVVAGSEYLVPLERWRRAYQYYLRTFVEPSGRLRYYAHQPWPEDSHALAVALLLLRLGREHDPNAERDLSRVFQWGIRRLWDPRGRFIDFRTRFFSTSVPYLRWSQAWMLYALAYCVSADDPCVGAQVPT